LKESVKTRKKLIEVALPLEAINLASAREKAIRHGHPSTLHLWWARRPLAAARAVVFAQMVDDPSSHPELFTTTKAQEKERKRLFGIIEELVKWENTTNEHILERARAEIWQSWRSTCADNAAHPRARELFDRHRLPAFHDPFAGGGAIPLEAQRLGLESYASDLNPVPVLINKAMIELPPKFVGREPVNPDWQNTQPQQKAMRRWNALEGLAEDVQYYGQWMRREAEKRFGNLYPKVEITTQMAEERPDLTPYIGRKLTVIAWLWARTVRSPNPAFSDVHVPLASTFILSKRAGKEAYLDTLVDGHSYAFKVSIGKPHNYDFANSGTKLPQGANFRCLMSGTPIDTEYIRAECQAGQMGERLMAVVLEGDRGRVYLSPDKDIEAIATGVEPEWKPDIEFSPQALGFRIGSYGMKKWSDLFTPRQLQSLSILSDIVSESTEQILRDTETSSLYKQAESTKCDDQAKEYAEAITTYLGLFLSRMVDLNNALCQWRNDPAKQHVGHLFTRQAIPMVWDFAEANPLGNSGGSFEKTFGFIPKVFPFLNTKPAGHSTQLDAAAQTVTQNKIVSTDPPYFDNVGYADLSDFFYVWLRRSLRFVYPALLATVSVPKADELVATPFRHGGKHEAEVFFLNGMKRAMQSLGEHANPGYPITIYYAFKQSETESDGGTSSTGWETFLEAVIHSGLSLTGTWPMRTELGNRMRGKDSNALASSIVLVCRPRPEDARTISRREFLNDLRAELPTALANLQRGNIAPVDLAQAAIGPGMAIYTRYAKVIDAEGNPLSVKQALAVINDVLDEVLAEQEGDFDGDTRWALTWFDQFAFAEGEYGVAETLANARNTSVDGMKTAGILASKAGKVRLLKPDELPSEWDPSTDERLTAWEIVHHLVRALALGESVAAELAVKLGSKAEIGRELAYRLYNICERRRRAQEALAYNGLVQSWPEILRLSREMASSTASQSQSTLFSEPK